MKNKEVFVVTNPEAGWDCIVGVYEFLKDAVESIEMEYVEGKEHYSYDHDCYVIHKSKIQ